MSDNIKDTLIDNDFLVTEGIWGKCDAQEKLNYPSDGNDTCFQLEDKSFWFKHRLNIINNLVTKYLPKGTTFLDVGGGNGQIASELQKNGYSSWLVEPSISGAKNALTRGVQNICCSTLKEAKLKNIDAIGAFDVIEHLDDDLGFINTAYDSLSKDGLLFLTVPAHSLLWSSADDLAQHTRRYSKNDLIRILSDKFNIIFISNFFGILLIPVLFLRVLPYRLGIQKKLTDDGEHGSNKGIIVKIINLFLSREKRVITKKKKRIGTSLVVVAKKWKST